MPAEGFQPARIEVFGLAGLPAVGSMQQLELVHAGSLPWAVRYVKVHNETNGEKAIFVPDRCASCCAALFPQQADWALCWDAQNEVIAECWCNQEKVMVRY